MIIWVSMVFIDCSLLVISLFDICIAEEVTCLRFHPKEALLASGSRDYTVKIFDYSKASAKKAFKTINETEHIEDIAFHPSGSHLLVGVRHPVIRLYDVNTTQCFTGSIPRHQHLDVITSLDWASDGRLYASCSSDGAIKVTKDCRGIFFA